LLFQGVLLRTAPLLDVELTQSSQQGSDGQPAVVEVINGVMGAAAPLAQNLTQTYDFGVAVADQTMTLTDAHLGGILIDGTSAAWTGAGTPSALEIRQSDTVAGGTPALLTRRGADAAGAVLRFDKARGTFAAPAPVQTNDVLGEIGFYGYPVGAFTQDARIVAGCLVNAGPNYATALDFYVRSIGGLALQWSMQGGGGVTAAALVGFANPVIRPDADHTGSVGEAAQRWLQANVDTVNAHVNVCLGGGAIAGAASHTVMLPNDGTQPGIQANQVYLGAEDFGGASGTNLAALEISSEEPAQLVGGNVVDAVIPIRFNGAPYLLHATNDTPG
jgi:hypothetical protein